MYLLFKSPTPGLNNVCPLSVSLTVSKPVITRKTVSGVIIGDTDLAYFDLSLFTSEEEAVTVFVRRLFKHPSRIRINSTLAAGGGVFTQDSFTILDESEPEWNDVVAPTWHRLIHTSNMGVL